jgi:hypothetical protein
VQRLGLVLLAVEPAQQDGHGPRVVAELVARALHEAQLG